MLSLKIKQKLAIIFLTLFVIPIQVFAYSDYIIAGGNNIGIELISNGIIIVGTYPVNGHDIAKEANLQIGDKITKINNKEVTSIDNMINTINEENITDKIKITYTRGNKEMNTNLNLELEENILKTGLYVKDSINGVGTLTFIDPETKIFGALGHEIIEKTTGQKFEIKDGKIYSSTVTSINPSNDGNPGEKNARSNINDVYGKVTKNTKSGVFGEYTDNLPNNKLYPVATKDEIETGNAKILTVIEDDNIEEFSINILKISNDNNESKNILFEITDKNLLNITGGIVQGMSGSPIIQNEKIIGAVTHVVVNDPTKGYGIFITNMLEEAEN